jgi:TRAP-type C4-dicarboxylate transport system substrate-binding protein
VKRLLLVPLIIVFAAGLVLCGCAEEAPAPSPAPAQPTPAPSPGEKQVITATPSPAPAPKPAAAPGKVYRLKFNDWGPPTIGIGQLHIDAAKMIEERTDGNVIITNYFSQSLLNYGDTYRGISSGIADISLYVIGATQGVHHINEVISLPFIGIPDMYSGTDLYNELRQKFPALDEENARSDTIWLDIRMMPPSQLHLVDRPATVPEDLKGLKIITGASLLDLLSQVDAAGVLMGPPDWYMSLERGLVQGQITHWPAVYDFHLLELFKYHTIFGGGGAGLVPIGFMANLTSWNELPPEYQKIIIDVYKWVNVESIKYDIDTIETAEAEAKEMGHILNYLTPEKITPWAERAVSYHEKWIADTEAKGWPAREVYNGLKELIAAYE